MAFLLLLFASHTQGADAQTTTARATYWVSKSGDDTHSCTDSITPLTNTAKRTISNALLCASAGDTIVVGEGTYTEALDGNLMPFKAGTNLITGSGAITIRALTARTVIINGGSGGNVINWTQPYAVFSGLIIDAKFAGQGFSLQTDYVRIENSEIRNATGPGGNGNGIFMGATSKGIEILDSWIHHNGSDWHSHGIYATGTDHLFQGNTIEFNTGYGIHIYSNNERNYAIGNTVRRNGTCGTSSNCAAGGILISSGADNVAINNIVANDRFGISVAYGCINCKVLNNTVYESTLGGYPAISIDPSVSGAVIQNNIVWNKTSTSLGTIQDLGSGSTISHNLCNTGCTGIGDKNGEDPLFVDPDNLRFASGPDFSLCTAAAVNPPGCEGKSPAINAGVDLSDINNALLPGLRSGLGDRWDMGAYETSGDLF